MVFTIGSADFSKSTWESPQAIKNYIESQKVSEVKKASWTTHPPGRDKGTEGYPAAIEEDLAQRTQALARSGLSVNAIKQSNSEYLMAIEAKGGTSALNSIAAYQSARSALNQRLVRLNVVSIPSGATVEIAGSAIGSTNIEKKPFEPNRTYRFTFSMSGYRTTIREYFVGAAPVEQTLTEVMVPRTAESQQFRIVPNKTK
jgi:hypothetical protein